MSKVEKVGRVLFALSLIWMFGWLVSCAKPVTHAEKQMYRAINHKAPTP